MAIGALGRRPIGRVAGLSHDDRDGAALLGPDADTSVERCSASMDGIPG